MTQPIPSGAEMTFDGWAVLELLGHRRLIGRVTDVKLFGQPTIRIEVLVWDEAKRDFGPSREQYASPNSLYALTPCTEEEARRQARPYVYDYAHRELPPAEASAAEKCPRPCAECPDGDHHFSAAMVNAAWDYECKHCDQTAEACNGCGEVVWPPHDSGMCGECRKDDFGA